MNFEASCPDTSTTIALNIRLKLYSEKCISQCFLCPIKMPFYADVAAGGTAGCLAIIKVGQDRLGTTGL